LDEVHRAGDVGVDDPKDVVEVLIEEAFAQSAPGIGQQRINRTPPDHSIELVDAFDLGEVGLQGIDFGSQRLEILARGLYFRLIGDHHQVEALLSATLRQFVPDAGRGPRHDG
jgi:hypothetical protein